jgi:hypothetical protein
MKSGVWSQSKRGYVAQTKKKMAELKKCNFERGLDVMKPAYPRYDVK